jgi:hypothetical protein
MVAYPTCRVARVVLALFLVPMICGYCSAQNLKESSAETRFQLDLHVPDEALKALLPNGFTSNVATQGPAKDCNLRVLFIDRITISGPDRKPIGKGSNRVVYLAAPVKDANGKNAQLIVGGLTQDPSDVPGPFGNYLQATTHKMQRSISLGKGDSPLIGAEDWLFAAPTGEHLEMHIVYERGPGNRSNPSDTIYYSAKNPSYYETSHQEQVLDILRNPATNAPDHVKKFSFKGGGGSYAKLFNGSEKLLSWDKITWIIRSVSVP